MKYKATLVGVPDLERPKQIFGADLAELEKWAESTLAKLSDAERKTAYVEIFEIKELFIKAVAPKVVTK